MHRRPTILLAALAAAGVLALSGCATLDDNAATADGTEISRSAFDDVADDYFSRSDVFGTAAPSDGRIDGDQARLLLGAMVRQQIFHDLLADARVDVDAERQTSLDALLVNPGFDTLGAPILELIVDSDNSFISQALKAVPAPSSSELEAMYARDPLSVGMVCLRHILVESEAEAAEAVDRLTAGESFAQLASELSTDVTTAVDGGAITSGSNDCIPLRVIAQGFDPAFADAVFRTGGHTIIGPVESSFGWHVIAHRPWEEIADSVTALHTDADSGGYQLDGRLATADIDVNPEFGIWDPMLNGVVPLG